MALELETERLRLRQWREDDVGPLLAFYNDPVSESIYGVGATRADIWRRIALFFGHYQLRGFGLWALEEKGSKSFVGYGGLWFPEGWDDVEVGYGIAPEHRRKGYAAETASRARDYGYETGIARLVSYIQPTNAASIAVATHLGAKPDGEFIMHGKPHTIYLHRKP
jgi:RimJ/RimL family protein N-acetyltransferase